MVLISHKQACRDLGLDPVQLRRWKKDVDKIRSLQKGTRKGRLTHPALFPVMEDRLHALILWVGQAWHDMHAADGDMIRQDFKQVGLGLPIDGSQDHDIKIKDFPDVRVGNWKDWQPTKGVNVEELQSNLTPEEVEKLASDITISDEDDVVDMDETIVVDVE
jgi:hypothetical protein